MKEWIVIHQIKALYNQGNGLSERQIIMAPIFQTVN
jgi:hypothetical protein